MGQIVGAKAKPKRANLNALSQVGTPALGEYVLVSTDNSMNADGQGDFDCYIMGDGSTAATALELKQISNDSELREIVGDGVDGTSGEKTLAFTKGSYVSTDGKSIATQSKSSYILLYDLAGATSIVWKIGSHTYDRLYLLDEDQNIVYTANKGTLLNIDLSIYPSAKYLSASFYSSGGGGRLITIYEGTNISAKLTEVSADVDLINAQIFNEGKVTVSYDSSQMLVNTYLNEGVSATRGGWNTTPLIAVTAGETYYLTGGGTNDGGAYAAVHLYNSEQEYMAWLVSGTYAAYDNVPFTIPENVSYIRCTTGGTPQLARGTKTSIILPMQEDIEQLKNDLYTVYKEIPYDESEIKNGFWRDNGVAFTSYGGYQATPFIPVDGGSTIFVDTKSSTDGVYCLFAYDTSQNKIATILQLGTFNKEEISLPLSAAYIKMNGQGETPRVYKKGAGTGYSKKALNKNINWVGMSIWWYDGKTLSANGVGGGVVAKGYQTLLKQLYTFTSDTGTNYCYSGGSLGGTSESDAYCITQSMSSWVASPNAIWTLDTITNDFKRNIPLGTTSDYDNATGSLTYYGALRAFADKVVELSGSDAIVIASNGLRRNNSGYTSTSVNSVGCTMQDYEKALMYVAMKNNWYFVDQYRLSALSDNVLEWATLDGLHCNNTGYRLAVIPWIAIFDQIFNILL